MSTVYKHSGDASTEDSNGNVAKRAVVSELGYTEGVLDVYDEEIYNASSGDATITATGLNKYTRWMIEVSGITIDAFNLQIALNVTASFPNSQFLAFAPVGLAKAPQVTISANGVYYVVADSDGGNAQSGNIFFNALFLDRTGSTDTIVVRALGRV